MNWKKYEGSVLGPLLFLVYINDIVQDIQSNIRLFADNASLFIVVDNPVLTINKINHDVDKISNWVFLIICNPSKTESLLFSSKRQPTNHPTIQLNGNPIKEVNSQKHIGLRISNNCHCVKHIQMILAKASSRLNILTKNEFFFDRWSLKKLYFSYIRSPWNTLISVGITFL